MSRRRWIIPGCALLAIIVVGVVVISAPAALALRLVGFRFEGKTDDQWDQQATAPLPSIQWPNEPAPTPAPTATPAADSPSDGALPAPIAPPPAGPPPGPEPLSAVVVDIWFLSEPGTFYAREIHADRLERGQTQDGRVAYYVEFSEEGLNAYLRRWFAAYVEHANRVRNAWVDLKPGGAVAYADVNLEVGWQRIGAILMLDASGRQLILAGVDVDGRFYSTPPGGRIAELAAELESVSNRALRELTFVDPAGRLTIQQISISEEGAQVLAY
jgi:hypothetical protein